MLLGFVQKTNDFLKSYLSHRQKSFSLTSALHHLIIKTLFNCKIVIFQLLHFFQIVYFLLRVKSHSMRVPESLCVCLFVYLYTLIIFSNVPINDLVNIFFLYIRSVAKQSSVVWSSSITCGEAYDLERIQKVALRLILGENYVEYNNLLNITNL